MCNSLLLQEYTYFNSGCVDSDSKESRVTQFSILQCFGPDSNSVEKLIFVVLLL